MHCLSYSLTRPVPRPQAYMAALKIGSCACPFFLSQTCLPHCCKPSLWVQLAPDSACWPIKLCSAPKKLIPTFSHPRPAILAHTTPWHAAPHAPDQQPSLPWPASAGAQDAGWRGSFMSSHPLVPPKVSHTCCCALSNTLIRSGTVPALPEPAQSSFRCPDVLSTRTQSSQSPSEI